MEKEQVKQSLFIDDMFMYINVRVCVCIHIYNTKEHTRNTATYSNMQ